jgi:hypothetical protein
MSDVRRRSRRASACWAPVFAILLLVICDATFDLYFWRIPKLTRVFFDFGYEFLSTLHQLERGKPEGAIRVVAFGSSVALSLDPHQVANLIETAEPTTHVDVNQLLLPGAKPSDYRLIWYADGEAIQADIAVAILNLADFLNPSFEAPLKEQVRYILPPWPTLMERHAFVRGISGQLDLMLASVSHFYRYRRLIRSCIQDHLKLLLDGVKQPRGTGGYGLYADGYARQRFGLPLTYVRDHELEYYIDPEWIEQQGRVTLEFSVDGRTAARRVEAEPGWKRVNIGSLTTSGVLDVVADSAWTPRAVVSAGDIRLLGVRLRQAAPRSAMNDDVPLRPYSPVTHRQVRRVVRRMGDLVGQAFVERWWQVVSADTPFGRQMRAYQREELGIRNRTFEPRGEYAEIERLIADLSRRGTAVVVVNSPESPLILSEYEDTSYYRAHVQFLRKLAGKYRGVLFYDMASALPMEDFNDWHHVNYIGVIKMGTRYAGMIRAALRNAPSRPDRTVGTATTSRAADERCRPTPGTVS